MECITWRICPARFEKPTVQFDPSRGCCTFFFSGSGDRSCRERENCGAQDEYGVFEMEVAIDLISRNSWDDEYVEVCGVTS